MPVYWHQTHACAVTLIKIIEKLAKKTIIEFFITFLL